VSILNSKLFIEYSFDTLYHFNMPINSHKHPSIKLGEFFSTAICGNDILSSSLYVSGIAIIFAGTYAPLVLLMVASVLFFYKTVYREVVEALPINGGSYNALLNGTTKTVAAIAGVMTILSYIATAVISAKTSIEYLFKFLGELFHNESFLQTLLIPCVLLVLFAFAILVIIGVKDSAKVAAAIFVLHIAALTSFVVLGLPRLLAGQSLFTLNSIATANLVVKHGGLLPMLFLAFSASLLGVSGFESSANFVEEQKPGVFKKTLRNMLVGVGIFNPLIAVVVLSFALLPDVAIAKDFILADIATKIGGMFYLGVIAIDAFMVLCGAVLTSYIGVSGLIKRMALDECLPPFLLKENAKGANPRIVLTFFALCASILLLTNGNLLSLAGVYAISFLGVMTMFACGNLILRQTRPELKRSYRAPVFFIVIAGSATLLGILGNAAIDFNNVLYFLTYFVPSILIVLSVIYIDKVLKFFMNIFSFSSTMHTMFERLHRKTVSTRFYVFVHHPSRLYDALKYIHDNETGHHVRIVHCDGDATQREIIKKLIPEIQKAGVFPHFKIDFDYLPEPFGPEAIDHYAKKRHIQKNRVFIGSIHSHHDFEYEDLGGVRIIAE